MGGKITLAIRRRFGYNSKVSSAGVMELVDVVGSNSAGAVFLLRFRQLHTGEDMLTSPALLFR